MSRVILHRIELQAAASLIPASMLSISFPETNPCVVVGKNGSGKSLVSASIIAALAPSSTSSLLHDLAQAGMRKIILTLSRDDEWLDLHVNVFNGTRSIQVHSAGSEAQSENGSAPGFHGGDLLFENGRLFTRLHCVLNGDLQVPDREVIVKAAQALTKPLEREIETWNSRLHLLVGENGESGQLGEVKQKFQDAKANLERVKLLLTEIDRIKRRHSELSSRLSEISSSSAVLKVERESVERMVGLAERAMRVETWLAEVCRDISRVESLRDEHAQTQEELDRLAQKFRGVPENFSDLLSEYELAVKQRDPKQAAWEELEKRRTELQGEIVDVERDLNMLKPPQSEGMQARIDELQVEIKEDESELVTLLRNRISLLRKREGFDQRLRSEFAEIAVLDQPVRDAVRKRCSQPETFVQTTDHVEKVSEDQRLIQKRLEDLDRSLQEDFEGFDILTEHAEDEILDLHITRSAISESSDLLESLQARIADVQRIGKGPRWIIAIIAAALVVGIPLGILLGWDIGLFGALIASGLIWLVYRNTNKAAEKKVLELTQHENSVRQRWKAAIESRIMLEKRLGPLAKLKKTEALAKLADYTSKSKDRIQLLHSLNEFKQRSVHTEPPKQIPDLPKCFAGMTPAQVLAKLEDYRELAAEKQQLDREWIEYESGGEKAGRIEEFEKRVSRRKGEVEELQNTQATENRQYNIRKDSLVTRLAELRAKLPDPAEVEALTSEIGALEMKLSALTQASGGILEAADPIELQAEWQRFCELRQRQRSLKDELSACLSLEEIRSRKSILTDELHEVTEQLSELDTLYLRQGNAAEYAQKYRSQLEDVSQQISENLLHIESVKEELESLETDSLQEKVNTMPSLETLESDLENFEQKLESVQREIRTTQELTESLRREIERIEPDLPGQIEAQADRLIRTHIGDEFGTICFADDEWFLVTPLEQKRSLRTLSRGQADLVRFIIRVAVLKLLDSLEQDFIIWDDVLGSLDDDQIDNMKSLLASISEKRQVILFARNSRLAEEGNVIELKPEASVQNTY